MWQARYRVGISKATAGNLVLIEGVGDTVTKTATIVAEGFEEEMRVFRSLQYMLRSVIKIAIGERQRRRCGGGGDGGVR